jgi:hypothetical protein
MRHAVSALTEQEKRREVFAEKKEDCVMFGQKKGEERRVVTPANAAGREWTHLGSWHT